jgi:hypothetical protein
MLSGKMLRMFVLKVAVDVINVSPAKIDTAHGPNQKLDT